MQWSLLTLDHRTCFNIQKVILWTERVSCFSSYIGSRLHHIHVPLFRSINTTSLPGRKPKRHRSAIILLLSLTSAVVWCFMKLTQMLSKRLVQLCLLALVIDVWEETTADRGRVFGATCNLSVWMVIRLKGLVLEKDGTSTLPADTRAHLSWSLISPWLSTRAVLMQHGKQIGLNILHRWLTAAQSGKLKDDEIEWVSRAEAELINN